MMRFDLTVIQLVFAEPRERRVVEKSTNQSLSALLICFKKYGVGMNHGGDFWTSEIGNTSQGRKRYEIFVESDGQKLSGVHVRTIHIEMESIDQVEYFA